MHDEAANIATLLCLRRGWACRTLAEAGKHDASSEMGCQKKDSSIQAASQVPPLLHNCNHDQLTGKVQLGGS